MNYLWGCSIDRGVWTDVLDTLSVVIFFVRLAAAAAAALYCLLLESLWQKVTLCNTFLSVQSKTSTGGILELDKSMLLFACTFTFAIYCSSYTEVIGMIMLVQT